VKSKLLAIVVGLTFASGCAVACSCLNAEFYLQGDPWARDVLAAKSAVFHARVIGVMPDGSAKLMMIEAMKGPKLPPVLRPDERYPTCGIKFSVNEEFIYLPEEGNAINLCSRLPVKRELLEAIRVMLKDSAARGDGPNRSLDPTRNDMPPQAAISFSAFSVLPSRSAQLGR